MARITTGDAEALGDLYDRFAGMLLALARRILGSRADAEEVVQECFLHVWERADRYDPKRASVSTWLVLITRSRAIDRLRSRGSKERVDQAYHERDPHQEVPPRGVESVLDRERRQKLRAILSELPAAQREVLDLAFYRGLSHREIAEETGIPLGTVKTRISLAMQKLRKSLHFGIEELL